jgi:predicted amidohydrolase
VAQPLTGPFVTALRAAAARAGVAVVAGSFTPGPDGRSYNTVVAIGPDGEVLGSYDKLHLYDAFSTQESTQVQAGPRSADHDALLTFRLGEVTFGVATCYDLRFPEIFRALVDRGATVFLVAAAWMPGPHKQDHWAHLLKARAIENTAFVVAADQCGPTGVGRSQIVDPMGRDLAVAGDEPQVISAAVDPSVVADTRRVNPSVANRRFSVSLRAAETPNTADMSRGSRDAHSS